MKRKRSRLALVGVLALAISVTVGLASGSIADAKKKKKKGGNSVTVSKTTPTPIPARSAPPSPDSVTTIPLTVGKKAKGKVVGWDSLTVTTSWSSPNVGFGADVFAEVTAPNGRTVGIAAPPVDATSTTAGPVTETPNSPNGFCTSATPPCAFPENNLLPPYAGTIGNPGLAFFGGVPARGTWLVKVFNDDTATTATLNSVSLSMTLKTAPV